MAGGRAIRGTSTKMVCAQLTGCQTWKARTFATVLLDTVAARKEEALEVACPPGWREARGRGATRAAETAAIVLGEEWREERKR